MDIENESADPVLDTFRGQNAEINILCVFIYDEYTEYVVLF